MITEPESSLAGVCILGWSRSRSQYFRFEPESTLRSVQEPIKIFKGPNFFMMLVVVKQNWHNTHPTKRLVMKSSFVEFKMLKICFQLPTLLYAAF